MAPNVSFNIPHSPQVFRMSSDIPVPLEPSTSYLTSVPQLQTPAAESTPKRRGWHRLIGTPSKSPIPSNVYVPDPPTPQSRQSGNDTPTPAANTPGSWRGRRRAGEFVNRPPVIRLNPPENVGSISPDVPSFMDGNGSEGTTQDLAAFQSLATQLSPTNANESQGSSDPGLNDTQQQQCEQRSISEAPIQRPPPAMLAPHDDQVDGAPDEDGSRRNRGHRSSCEKLRGSLRGIPSKLHQLFNKRKADRGTSEQIPIASEHLAPQTQKQIWWSESFKRLRKGKAQGRKPFPERECRRSASSSFRQLFSSSGTANQTSTDSDPPASQKTTPFDDVSAPQAFGAPTHEEDTPISDEPEPYLEEERILGEQTMRDRLEKARESTERKKQARSTEQLSSTSDAGPGATLDGSFPLLRTPAINVPREVLRGADGSLTGHGWSPLFGGDD
ncbi:MAG: hypothetical protein Q9201_007078 [Fulgogasparrea decipioides]